MCIFFLWFQNYLEGNIADLFATTINNDFRHSLVLYSNIRNQLLFIGKVKQSSNFDFTVLFSF